MVSSDLLSPSEKAEWLASWKSGVVRWHAPLKSGTMGKTGNKRVGWMCVYWAVRPSEKLLQKAVTLYKVRQET